MARPLPVGFEVRESKPFNGKAWRSTEEEANTHAADRNAEMQAYGSKVNLDSEARLEAFMFSRCRNMQQAFAGTAADAEAPWAPRSSSFVLIFGVIDALIARNSQQSPNSSKNTLS
jgi:hypothetical protein